MSGSSEADAVVREVFIAASPAAVFPYFTDPTKLTVWKAVRAETDGRLGGSFRVDVTGRGDIAFGTYLEVDPPKRVVFSWRWANVDANLDQSSSVVEVTLVADGDGTRVRLIHRGVAPEQRLSSGKGWTHYLERLAIAAPGGDPGPDPWATLPTDTLQGDPA